jgi:hypothetical protein
LETKIDKYNKLETGLVQDRLKLWGILK